jgi:hypothetical protein
MMPASRTDRWVPLAFPIWERREARRETNRSHAWVQRGESPCRAAAGGVSSAMPLTAPTPRRRLLVAVAIAGLTAAVVWVSHGPAPSRLDFDYFWIAGQAVAHSHDPYRAVHAAVVGRTVRSPLYYPATMAVVMAPFGMVSRPLALALFVGGGMGLLAFAVTREAWWRLGVVASAPALHAMTEGQWSPWTTAAIGLPWLGLVWAAKPSVGLALFAGWPSRAALVGVLVLTALAFLVVPHWPAAWLTAIRGAPQYLAPVQRPWGWLLLLAWLRWRTPEGRFLGALALVPHTAALFETLPLLLFARRPRELSVLLTLGWLAWIFTSRATAQMTTADVPVLLARHWPAVLVCCYLPALALVLSGATRRTETSMS